MTSSQENISSPLWSRPYRYPWVLLVFALLFTLASLYWVTKVRVGNDLEAILKGNPAYPLYRQFLQEFGSDEGIVCFFVTGDLSREALLELYDLVHCIEELEFVQVSTSVLSLIPSRYTKDRETFDRYLKRPRTLGRIAASIKRTRLARKRLASKDLSALAVLVRLDMPSGGGASVQRERRKILSRFRQALKGKLDKEIGLLGYPVIEDRVLQLIKESNVILMPMAVFVGSTTLLIVFRRLTFLLAAMGGVLSGLFWMLATFPLRNYTLNAFSTMLFPLVLSIGLTSTIHILSAYLARARRRRTKEEHPELTALPEVIPPCVLCTTTTFIGFISLAVNDISEIRNFGIYAAVGTLFSLGAALLYIPTLLKLTKFGEIELPQEQQRDRLGGWLALFASEIYSAKKAVGILFIIALFFSMEGIRRLPVESASIKGLYDSDPLIVTKRAYEKGFEPLMALELLIKLPNMGTVLELDGFRAICKFQQGLEKIEGVRVSLSACDLLLDTASFIAKKEKRDIPTEKELELLERFLRTEARSGLMKTFISQDGDRTRVHVTIEREGSLAILRLSQKIRKLALQTLPKGTEVTVTGRNYLSAITHLNTMRNELTCFLLSVLAILIVLMVTFKSIVVGLLSAVPNILPLTMTFGTMGWLGVPFNITTGMILCVTIGLVVDDTIHYLFCYRKHRLAGDHIRLAIKRASARVGRPIISTSIILATGISVLTLSKFRMIVQFGCFTSLTIVYALFADLVLLPALLGLFPRVLGPSKGE